MPRHKPIKIIYTIASIAIAGCSSGEATTTTVEVAPPAPAATTTMNVTTTIVTTTTSPPSTTTTTAVAATASQTPEQIIADRHLAFAHVVDQCGTDPPACDPATMFTEYVSPDSEQYTFYADGVEGLVNAGQRIAEPERIVRHIVVAEIGADGTTGHTVNCVANSAVYLDASNDTLPHATGYGREDFFWEQIDGKWIATSGVLEGLSSEGDGQCSF